MVERIPEEKIEEIRHSVDIVDVVSEYVQLKKQGRNYFGLCPFHDEKTPSFSVSPEKQIFHCFGCGAGGNVFSFLMDLEGLSFQEAALKLAEKANVELNLSSVPSNQHKVKQHDLMIEVHELLRKFYHHLLVNTKEGQEALDYLYSRGFTDDTIDEFQLGYAPNGWDTSLKFLTGRGYEQTLLEQLGLIIRRDNGTYFDRFRERIMFPIHDQKGSTIAFSGRIFKDGEPKYLNSPESVLFQKNKLLYNFHRARPSIRKKQFAVLFEGFADCISAYHAGVTNGVATMGTALTDYHIQLLKRNVERIVLCFDSDEAGKEAVLRAGEMLQRAGLTVEVALVPDGKDPDEYIQKHGSDQFIHEVIEARQTFMAFKMEKFRSGKNLESEGERLSYIEKIITEISQLQSPIEKEIYLRRLADEFSLSLEALKQQERQISYRLKRGMSARREKNLNRFIQKQDKKLMPAYYNAERILIAHMLKSVQITALIQEKMKGYTFHEDDHQAIITYLYAYYESGQEPDLSHFLSFIKDPHLRKVVAEIGMMQIQDELTDQELTDYLNHVLKYQKLLKIKEKEAEGKRAEQEKDYKKAAEIAQEIVQLRKTL
ncbi:DNA primase [Fervidibacillus halotolerans]|uniref:DNA primase n=1 Tax=Fervidibacillus halotolerans TaxID=2980027 RepID=A0A9E8LYT7_9BACI|nr:DNA primase [Fervidibacillus halotolerans]WAA11486.1 DNA primase [Fervidibacillus halotolerans]